MKNGLIKKQDVANYGKWQRGASLLEGIAYLGIAAIVILGAVSLLSSAFGNAQSNRALEEIVSIRTAVRKLYAGQQYTTNMTSILKDAKAFPATISPNASGTMMNAWNGAVTVTGAHPYFTITYNNVPKDVCISLISGATGWTQISQGSGSSNAITIFPAKASEASTTCSEDSNNVVNFQAS
ncbi:pilus assembly protein [Noviherbaspirillum cavernae]|uniref:Pilus assembly protein n=1 Tax=Noviherbaspirillum cavernae TaxID=2320862 RepID=A0A418WW20_9BURK|nr:type 4 pilus major pilin [Noviherbaspirillum cavernae]RJF96857.1 pilus assembly protein [Noviherbaspirillum cavernae]